MDSINTDQQKIIDNYFSANKIYESVMKRLNILEESEENYQAILSILKKQSQDHIVKTIWNALSPDEIKNFANLLEQRKKSIPFLSTEAVLMQFALESKHLKKKIFDSLEFFFDDFVAYFNKINSI